MTAGWTEDRVGALKKLWLEGQSASQIAKQLGGGVTRNAVIGKVHRLGLSGRATPSQPARTATTTFRPAKTRTTPPKQDFGAPSAPRTLQAVAPRPSAPVPPTPLPVVTEMAGTATVLTLGAHMCKWPIGDPSSTEFSFCGRRASEGVYCVEHARVAYQPQVKKNGSSELTRSLRRYI
ncbi:cell cycle sigma 70 cofactor GcrA [soil metagenome]